MKKDRPLTAVLPSQFAFWPSSPTGSTIQQMYDAGYAGAWHDPVAKAQFRSRIQSSGGSMDGAGISIRNGLYGAGNGQLVPTFRIVEKMLPGCWPGQAQEVGDCVSHSTKNAILVTMCCDISSGKSDEKTGDLEALPEIDPEGIKNGALSSETFYWYRGYSGDGWSCDAAADVACHESGLFLRNNYPELGIDLRRYSGSQAHRYGRSKPPQPIQDAGRKHLAHTATELDSPDEWRDYLANGYGLTTCGGEGWSSKRDDNGFSKRSGSWSHAMAFIGYDDRDEIKKEYGEALVLVLNSWGKWNGGGRRILGTDIDIPEGSFWARVSDCRRRQVIAFAGVVGFKARSLPDLGFSVLG